MRVTFTFDGSTVAGTAEISEAFGYGVQRGDIIEFAWPLGDEVQVVKKSFMDKGPGLQPSLTMLVKRV